MLYSRKKVTNELVLCKHIFTKHYFVQVLFPVFTGKPAKQSSVNRYKDGIERILAQFEAYWLHSNKFLAGSEISIADILAVCELQQTGELTSWCNSITLLDWRCWDRVVPCGAVWCNGVTLLDWRCWDCVVPCGAMV